jgi:hypothetical protein
MNHKTSKEAKALIGTCHFWEIGQGNERVLTYLMIEAVKAAGTIIFRRKLYSGVKYKVVALREGAKGIWTDVFPDQLIGKLTKEHTNTAIAKPGNDRVLHLV